MQAMTEDYSDKDYAVKKKEGQAMKAHPDAKDKHTQFNMVMSETQKDLKQQKKRNNLSDAFQLIIKERFWTL
jgi:hypothetical protein